MGGRGAAGRHLAVGGRRRVALAAAPGEDQGRESGPDDGGGGLVGEKAVVHGVSGLVGRARTRLSGVSFGRAGVAAGSDRSRPGHAQPSDQVRWSTQWEGPRTSDEL